MLIALLIIARAAQIGASMLLAGIFTFELVTLGPAGSPGSDDLHEVERRLLRLARWSLIAALLSALLWFWLEVTNMSGLPLTRAFSTTAWQAVLFQTEFGRVWQLRLGLIVVALVLAALGFVKAQLRRALTVALFLVSVTLLVSLDWISHAAAARATAWFVRRSAPSLRRRRLDRRAPSAGNFSDACACVGLVRRKSRSGAATLFHPQPGLRRRSRRQWSFQ